MLAVTAVAAVAALMTAYVILKIAVAAFHDGFWQWFFRLSWRKGVLSWRKGALWSWRKGVFFLLW